MKVPANPLLLRAAVVFFCASFSFLLGLIFMRMLRKSISEEAEVSSEAAPGFEAMPMHVYNTVILQLKQQKNELQAQLQTEQQRVRTNDLIAQAILSNLSSGVLIFGANGLVKSNNPAAKEILGFASLTGMDVEDIFRGAEINGGGGSKEQAEEDASESASEEYPIRLADEIAAVLRGGMPHGSVESEYETPAGGKRDIAVTIVPLPSADGGVACLVDIASTAIAVQKQLGSQSATASAE